MSIFEINIFEVIGKITVGTFLLGLILVFTWKLIEFSRDFKMWLSIKNYKNYECRNCEIVNRIREAK